MGTITKAKVKLFKNHSEYSNATEKPCVSHCIQDNKVHYDIPPIPIIDGEGISGPIVWEDPREEHMS